MSNASTSSTGSAGSRPSRQAAHRPASPGQRILRKSQRGAIPLSGCHHRLLHLTGLRRALAQLCVDFHQLSPRALANLLPIEPAPPSVPLVSGGVHPAVRLG
eukprot:4284236-Pleurochrysis_carterae.AAC.1